MLGQFMDQSDSTTAHLFPKSHGVESMTGIMGEEVRELMDDPVNVVVMSTVAKKTWDLHYWTLEPAVKNPKDMAEYELWYQSEPRQYRIEVLVKNDSMEEHGTNGLMTMDHDLAGASLRSLASRDGELFKFDVVPEKQPSRRFILFHNVIATLKARGKDGAPEPTTKDGGNLLFGTVGKYLTSSTLLGVTDYLGHEYASLLPPDWSPPPQQGPPGDVGANIQSAASVQLLLKHAWEAPPLHPSKQKALLSITEKLEGDSKRKAFLVREVEESNKGIERCKELVTTYKKEIYDIDERAVEAEEGEVELSD